MGFVTYGELIGVFSSDYGPDDGSRLDIGLFAMKKFTPVSTLTKTTMLRIQRLDGPSIGDVEDTHIVGIFSEDGKYRLDIGTASMKMNTSPAFLSTCTQLKIWPAEKASVSGDESKEGQNINYDDIIGVFSEDGLYRLNLGSDALNPQKKDHVSSQTKLILHDADPVVEVTKIRNLTYKLEEAKTTTHPKEVFSVKQKNETMRPQSFAPSGECEIQEAKTFSNAVSFTAGITVSVDIGIPLVMDGSVEVSAEASETVEWGKEITTTKSKAWNAPCEVDPRSAMQILVMISDSKVEVPYEMVADVKLLSGKWERRTVPGTFKGHNASEYSISYTPCDLDGNATGPPTTRSFW